MKTQLTRKAFQSNITLLQITVISPYKLMINDGYVLNNQRVRLAQRMFSVRLICNFYFDYYFSF